MEHTKGMMLLDILEILKEHTDSEEGHQLTIAQIVSHLEKDYGIKAERKAVSRNLELLMELTEYVSCASAEIRAIPETDFVETLTDPETGKRRKVTHYKCDPATGARIMKQIEVPQGYYYRHEFDSSELRYLIDSLLFSGNVPYGQAKELIRKLSTLSGKYFQSGIRHIHNLSHDRTDNPDLFFNLELIGEAVDKKRMVRFHYMEYHTDKKLHRKVRTNGSEWYAVSPYQMAVRSGQYYLICNLEGKEELSNFRLDRIRDAEMLNEPARAFDSLPEAKRYALDLGEYMKTHPYMYAGKTVHAEVRIPGSMVGDVIELFGKDVKFRNETETHVNALVYANEGAILQFAKTYLPDAVILSPRSLAEQMHRTVEQYRNDEQLS